MTANNENTICDILKFEGIMSKGFGMAPRLVMRDTRLSIEAKAIYCYFQSFAGNAEKAFPKRETILNELQISKNRYYKYLQELIDYDYVRIQREEDENSWKGRNIYVIVANPQSDNPDPPEKKTVCNEKTGKGQAEKAPEQKADAPCQAAPKKRAATGALYRRLGIPALLEKYPDEKRMLYNIYDVIKDMASSEEIRIGGAVKKKDAIDEIIGQLTDRHIIAVLKAVRDNREKIHNMRAWIQVCLVNSLYDDELDEKAEQFDKRYCKAKQKPQEQRPHELSWEERMKTKAQFPYLMEREKEINSLSAKLARQKIYGNTQAAEDMSRQIKELEEEMKQYIHENGIEPGLYAFT